MALPRFYRGREAEIVEELARHYSMAKDVRQTSRWTALAGEKAPGLFACETANHWFKQALALLSTESETDQALLGRTLVYQMEAHCWEIKFPTLITLAKEHLPRIKAAVRRI